MKVLVSDPLAAEGLKLLSFGIDPDAKYQYELDVNTGLSEDEIIKIIGNYEALIIRSGTQVTAKVIAVANNLKVIGRAGVGVDNVDVQAASMKGIIVMNTPDGNTISAAEHTVSMMLSLSRNIPQANASLKNKEWNRKFFTGTEVYGKTLGVIGLGKIGFEVAKRAKAFEMNLIVYDPFTTKEHAAKIGAKLVSLDEVFSNSDYITLHLPRTKETENLIAKDTIAKMKDGVRIINVARGGIVNESDLTEALKSGKVKGAAIDVFDKEPSIDSPLFFAANAIVTPHLGASTEEAQINVAIDIVRQIRDFFENNAVKNAVNMASLSPEDLAEMKPFIELAEKIGLILCKIISSKGGIEEVEIRYAGDISGIKVAPITVSFLKGLLQGIEENVNFVNASFLAGQRGIKIKEVTVNKIEDLVNLISVTVKTDKEEMTVAGTVFFGNNMRIIKIENYNVDISPYGYILLSRNEDIPGVVGKLGSKLAEEGINIANMQVSRSDQAKEALMVTTIDQEITKEILTEIQNIPEIKEVKIVSL
ncbi:MAG: phosphoglycerate dehydrogenase [bacterium]|nr:phosphoglycerate dehydrogenase [bacterium]